MDLLGQSRKLEQLFIPTGSADRGAAINALKQTFGHVSWFRKSVEMMRKELSQSLRYSPKTLNTVTLSEQKVLHKYNRVNIKAQFRFDSAILTVPLKGTGDSFPLMSIQFLFNQLAGNMMFLLAVGLPTRTGIAVGICDYLDTGELYGQGTARAHRCESKAGYPRIVIHPSFINYLDSFDFTAFSSDERKYCSGMMERIRSCLERDTDGEIILSYLCPVFWEQFIVASNHQEILKRARLFIANELAKWSKANDSELGKRYSLLKEYFKKHNRWVELTAGTASSNP